MKPEAAGQPGFGAVPRGRFAAFLAFCLVGALLLEHPLTVGGAAPDFLCIALVYSAVRWGALGGAATGFGLGLLRDTLFLLHFGLQAFGLTVIGYAIGKLRDTLYLSAPGVDLGLLVGAKLALDVLVLAVVAGGSWGAFEARFFWEAPLAAGYTALLGGGVYRLARRA